MDNESLKRYQRDLEKFFAESDTSASPEALAQKAVDAILGPPLDLPAAQQADTAYDLVLTFLRIKGMKPAKARELAGKARTQVEFAVWKREREAGSN
jgi:hypothetical protein